MLPTHGKLYWRRHARRPYLSPMKNRFGLAFLLAIATLVLSSCGTISQEIWINADGSGRMDYSFDMSEMLPMLAMMPAEATEEMDGPSAMLMPLLTREKLDTTIQMAKVIPDSVKEMFNNRASIEEFLSAQSPDSQPTDAEVDQAIQGMKAMEQMQMLMHIDKAAEELSMGMRVDFSKQQGIAGATEVMGGMKMMQGAAKSSEQAPYRLVGKTLQIRISSKSAIEQMEQALSAQGGGASMDEAAVLETMETMGMSELSVVIHLPGEIKEVKGVSHTKLEANSVLIKIPMLELIQSQKDFSADISFKPKKKYAKTVPK